MKQSVDRSSGQIWEIIRGLLPIALVAMLARLSVAQDVFSQISKPIVLGIISLFHVPVADLGDAITIGRLNIPWTEDCAGVNMLVLLLAVAIWLNRQEPFNLAHWLRVLGMFPAAVIGNVLRVFSVVAYRSAFYPEVETPQLHYFFGLFWLVPFAFLAMPKSPRHLSARLFELIHVAAVIALLAPQTYGPGGLGMTIAVVIGLSHCHLPEKISRGRILALILWVLAAIFFSFANMESFWIPWMIVCPLMSDSKWLFSPAGVLLTLATHPLFAILPWGEVITWGVIAYVVWKKYILDQPDPPSVDPHVDWSWKERSILGAVAVLFLLPFLASTFFVGKKEMLLPPKIADSQIVPGDGFILTMPGQPKEINLVWYNPSGAHRHHTLTICLKYLGVELQQTKEDPSVFTDGKHWLREFYLQGGRLLSSHIQYVISTLVPGSSPGIHLIYVTDSQAMSAREFDDKTQRMAGQLFDATKSEHR
jgi:exosortase/archaeosortase family protein